MKPRFHRLFSFLRNPAASRYFRGDDRLLLISTGMLAGLCGGLAAVLLSRSLEYCLHISMNIREYWWAVFIPGAGAALSSLFLNHIMKEGAGHGVPEVIYAVSRYGGLLRLRSSFSRLASSCLTIGAGGSAGPEAPIVMSGAAIGSNLARFFRLNDRQRITLVGCGTAGAIAGIFNAPITGLVFTAEVILGEWTGANIVPIAMASVAGAELSRLLQGNQNIFAAVPFSIGMPDIIASAGLALAAAATSILLTRALRRMHHVSAGLSGLPLFVRAALGGIGVGLIGMAFPMVMGEGYHYIQEMIDSVFLPGMPIAVIALLLKILATSLTLGWGGSGGIFAPSLVLGAFTGISFHRFLVLLWPGVDWVAEGCFALLGMAGLISGILQAPLTGIFLVVEITGSYNSILPLIVVSAFSSTLCQYIEPASIYLKDLVEKGELLRPGTDERVLSDLRLTEVLEKDCISVSPHTVLRDFIGVIQQSRRNYWPVEESPGGTFAGMVHLDDIRPYLFNPGMYDAVLVDQVMTRNPPAADLNDDLQAVLARMDELHVYSMPVLYNGRFMGMVSKGTLLDRYRKELKVQTLR
ncbi:MAG: chloride channel protein [Desulfobacterales bacterium]|nr:MAG: chloride channel protein [Desulfobacterales bacterium]